MNLADPMRDGEVRLEPLAEAHREGLRRACAQDLDIWRIYAASFDPEHFDGSCDLLLARPNGQPYAILEGERLARMSAYIGNEPERALLQIGNTHYVPDLRGTGFNRRIKDLMIGRAIACGYRRIEFRVDARNARSQAAMSKIGGVREGVMRQDRITWTGHVRDTVLFSILADEWKGSGDGR